MRHRYGEPCPCDACTEEGRAAIGAYLRGRVARNVATVERLLVRNRDRGAGLLDRILVDHYAREGRS